MGSSQRTSFSYCEVSGQGFSAVEQGRHLILEIPVRATAKMQRKRVVYSAAADRAGLRQNWKVSGVLPE